MARTADSCHHGYYHGGGAYGSRGPSPCPAFDRHDGRGPSHGIAPSFDRCLPEQDHFAPGGRNCDRGPADYPKYGESVSVPPKGYDSQPSYLKATMQELRGERSVHGLSSYGLESSQGRLPYSSAPSGPSAPAWASPAGAPHGHDKSVPAGAQSIPPGMPTQPLPHPRIQGQCAPHPGMNAAMNHASQPMWPPPAHSIPGGCAGFPNNPTASFLPPTTILPPTPAVNGEMTRGQHKVSQPLAQGHAGAPQAHSAGPKIREAPMTNGFKDSTEYIDAGDESEVEFMSTRSRPPPRKKKGEGKSRRIRDEVSCMPCLVMC